MNVIENGASPNLSRDLCFGRHRAYCVVVRACGVVVGINVKGKPVHVKAGAKKLVAKAGRQKNSVGLLSLSLHFHMLIIEFLLQV